MIDTIGLRAVAARVEAAVLAVPGVVRAQDRPGMTRVARRLAEGIAAGVSASPGERSTISVSVTAEATTVELDVVVESDHAAPEVARAVAAAVLGSLDLEDLPPASVDVRVVAVG